MATALPRAVLKDGKLRLRTAVAYHVDRSFGSGVGARTFMLSVYVLTYKYKSHDEDEAWLCAQRIHVTRDTPEKEQLMLLDAMAYKVACMHNRDYEMVIPATPKKPTKEK